MLKIDLPPDLEKRFRAIADEQGRPAEELLVEVLEWFAKDFKAGRLADHLERRFA